MAESTASNMAAAEQPASTISPWDDKPAVLKVLERSAKRAYRGIEGFSFCVHCDTPAATKDSLLDLFGDDDQPGLIVTLPILVNKIGHLLPKNRIIIPAVMRIEETTACAAAVTLACQLAAAIHTAIDDIKSGPDAQNVTGADLAAGIEDNWPRIQEFTASFYSLPYSDYTCRVDEEIAAALLREAKVAAQPQLSELSEQIQRVCQAVEDLALQPPQNAGPPTGEQIVPGDDFRSVRCGDATYLFTANQAAVVAVLYEHWTRGTPDVGDETLLKAVDHEAPPPRLNVVFRDSEAWNTLIVSGGTKGTHRLQVPAE